MLVSSKANSAKSNSNIGIEIEKNGVNGYNLKAEGHVLFYSYQHFTNQ